MRNTRNLKSMVATLACVGLAIPLTACGSTPAATAPNGGDGGQTTLSFVYMGTPEQQESWNKLFAEFEKQNPNIKLKASGIGVDNWGEFFNKVSTQIAGGDVPDIVQVATEGQLMFASKGLLAPLDDFIAKDKAVIDEYYADVDPNLVEWAKKYGSTDGKTYYLPGEFNTMALWCNTDVLGQAGVTLPSDGAWTWDDFTADAKAVKDSTGAFMYNAAEGYFTGLMPWITTAGGSTLNEDWSQPTFDSPPVVDALTYLRGLIESGYSPKPGGSFDAYTQFAQGKLACFGGGRWPIIQMRDMNMVDKIQMVSFPTKAGKGSPIGTNGYPILKDSKNKEAAWEFVKFLISKDGSAFFAELGGTIVPARRSVANSDAFLANSPKGTEVLYDSVSFATVIPSPDQGAQVQLAIEDGALQVLAGNVSPADGAKQTQEKLLPLVTK